MNDSFYNNNSIIFCLSYLSVPITVQIIEKSNSDFLIVSSSNSIITFFKRFYSEKNLYYIEPKPLLSKNPFRLVHNLVNIYLYKKKIYCKFHLYRNYNIFFFGVAYCEFESWLVKKLSQSNIIFYKPAAVLKKLNVSRSIYSMIGKSIRKMVYSISFESLTTGKNTCFAVKQDYLQKINARNFDIIIDNEIIFKKIINSLPGIESARILILCGGTMNIFVDQSIYFNEMDRLIESLIRKYGLRSIAIKAHPRFNDYHSKENMIQKIPSDIAANLILRHFDIVIGYSTAALIEASSEGVKSISLLKLIKPIDENIRDTYISYLESNSEGSIFYPESMKKLIAIINK